MWRYLFERTFLFDADEGAGASGDSAAGDNGGDNSPGDAPPGPSGSGGDLDDSGENAPPSDDVTMPRGTFNDRIEKERRAGQRALLAALGFDAGDPESLEKAQGELVDLVKFAREQRTAQMTAEERTQEQVAQAEKLATDAQASIAQVTAERDTAQATLRSFVLHSIFSAAAVGRNAAHPEDVVAWINTHHQEAARAVLQEGEPLLTDEGAFNTKAVDQDAVKALVAECVKARSEWFRGTTPGIPSNAHGQPPQTDPQRLGQKQALANQIIGRGF